jgi:hypothetical protein
VCIAVFIQIITAPLHMPWRNIDELFQAKMPQNPHDYCVFRAAFLSHGGGNAQGALSMRLTGQKWLKSLMECAYTGAHSMQADELSRFIHQLFDAYAHAIHCFSTGDVTVAHAGSSAV